MGSAADCETIGTGFLGQPVNSLTTIGFLLVGTLIVMRRPDRRWIGIGLITTGVGSFLFHGPMPPGNEWAHDVTLAWLIAVVAGAGTRWKRISRLPALLVLGILFALAPGSADPIAAGLTVVALVSIVGRDTSSATLAPLLLLATVAVYGRLGATGGPLCDPGSIFQPHAVWHMGAAAAVAWWGLRPAPPVMLPLESPASREGGIEMIQEFKDFINRGNLVDIAVAFVLGLAFAAVITSLTNDIINPIIAKIFTLDNLADWVVADIRIGAFIVALINFVIVAFVMFLVVKAYNRMRTQEEEAPSEEIVLLQEIRDSLNR